MDSKNLSNNQIVTVKTTSQVIEESTLDFIAQNPSALYNETFCSAGVTEAVKLAVDLENTVREKAFKIRVSQDITILSVAICISVLVKLFGNTLFGNHALYRNSIGVI